MATALDLITDALVEIGAKEGSETPTAAEAAFAFRKLNRFLNTLAAENLTIYEVRRSTGTLTANQTSFTVGAGGNINIERPVFIDHIGFVDTAPTIDLELPLTKLTDAAYEALRLKALTNVWPTSYWYSPTFPTGTLYPWPIPTSTTLLWAVYHWVAVPQFAALTTTISLPPAYEEMLFTNLAVQLCPSWTQQPSPVLVKRATDTMATLKRANIRLVDMAFPGDFLIGYHGGSRDIYAGP